jgi:hypothetical protein
LEDSLPVDGLVEVDESYSVAFAKVNTGAAQPTGPVFGILKGGIKVTTVMIPDVRKDTLLTHHPTEGRSGFDVYTDSYPL